MKKHPKIAAPLLALLAAACLTMPAGAQAPARQFAIKPPPLPAISATPLPPVTTPAPKPINVAAPGTAERPKLRHIPKGKAKRARPARSSGPVLRVNRANDEARVQPMRDGFVNAVQTYAFANGALYQVYTTPGHITDIMLEPGEQLSGSGPVAAGDTARWVIGATTSGSGPGARVHILVKPTREGLSTNLIVNTDRRTYHLELKSTSGSWMAALAWDYPQDMNVMLAAMARAEEAAPLASGIAPENLRFGYRLSGDKPDWRPAQVFDDGVRTFVAFPPGIAQTELPPLFVVGAGGALELVNTRVRGTWLIVDRLFERAELRLGQDKKQIVVRIEAPKRKGRS